MVVIDSLMMNEVIIYTLLMNLSLSHPFVPHFLSSLALTRPLYQIVTVKSRYMILNETGFTIEYKQCGSPDPSMTAVSHTAWGGH